MIYYAIKNEKGDYLNIRITDSENNPIYNSFKEKRFWISGAKEKAFAQASILDMETEHKHAVVEITEIGAESK